jgi:nucleoside-diphosphate-sugar epimerase
MVENAPHSVAHLLHLIGVPDRFTVEVDSPVVLPTGVEFYRRWRIHGTIGKTAFELKFAFGAGYPEHRIHVRGLAGSATADLLRGTYLLRRPTGQAEDFDRYRQVTNEGKILKGQARKNLLQYLLSKFKLSKRGNFFGTSIAESLRTFYADLPNSCDQRLSATFAAEVITWCEKFAQAIPASARPIVAPAPSRPVHVPSAAPSILILGGFGFIGRALVSRLVQGGKSVRLLARDPNNLPGSLRNLSVDIVRGDMSNPDDLHRAMSGIDVVYHLARSHVKTKTEYEQHEIGATRTVAEAALTHGIKRFIYTGTISSLYQGDRTTTINDQTPTDPEIHSRDYYSWAKAESERLLLQLHREKQLPLVIFRPGIVIGAGSEPFHWGVGFWGATSMVRLWGKGLHLLPFILVDDVADALFKALDAHRILGETFNLVGEPCLSGREYAEQVEKAAQLRIDIYPTGFWRFYLNDLLKWMIKFLIRHPERRFPSYRDWKTRGHFSTYDCSKAKRLLNWEPTADREKMIQDGIVKPVMEWLA